MLKTFNIIRLMSRLLTGRATKKEKIILFIKAISSLLLTTGGLLFLVAVMSFVLIFEATSSNTGSIGGGKQFPEEVLRWKPRVQMECERNKIPEKVNIILAIIAVETGGNAERWPDIMQSSESQGWPPNTITDPYKSIEIGVRYFAEAHRRFPEHDLMNIIQSYNFGHGFLSYADFDYNFETAVSFARTRANGVRVTYTNSLAVSINGGWRYRFGNMFYAKLIEQFLQDVSIGDGEFRLPVSQNFIMTSPFGYRIHPISGVRSFHRGIDLVTRGEVDPPIFATADGVVVFSGWASGYGNYIVIQHDETTFSGYGHNRQNLVSVGDRVSAGQQIAIMGTTGDSTGVHLHFEIMMNTSNFWEGHVDPAPLLGIN